MAPIWHLIELMRMLSTLHLQSDSLKIPTTHYATLYYRWAPNDNTVPVNGVQSSQAYLKMGQTGLLGKCRC